MSEQFKLWLAKQLNGLVSVQRALIGGDADMTIFMWSGVQIRVHFVNQSVKIRNIKRVLQDAGEIGIGSLFLVDGTMMPKDGQRVEVPDWLLALHMLNHERIYAYRMSESGPEIYQLHFEQVVGTQNYKTWVGPRIPFDKLRFFRVSIKHRLMKGDWLIADFGSSAFWKTNDYRTYRYQQEAAYRQQRQTRWQEWSGYQTWQRTYSNNGSAPVQPLGEYLEKCCKILGIEPDCSKEDAKRAFRKLAINFHPDTSDLPPKEAEEKFRVLSEAYEYIKAAKGWG